ncbi:MAG: hypothetical protein CBC13_05595 [Planctomycetia bacterium TMED53]|nr:MAG: hypothetical protein CBC13_05595 [Planctomycetia bacterium TMED53]
MIRLDNVTKTLSGRKILSELSLSVEEGETLVLLGRSGTGKSVTLRHIVGLMQPDHGKVEVLGKDVSSQNPSILTEVRKKVGYLFQDGALLNWLTVKENVALPLIETLGVSANEIEERVQRVLREVELDSHGDKFPGEISGGMRKRAGLARALVCDPQVVLHDEPTSGLDPISSSIINQLVNQLKSTGITQVLVTHDMNSAFEVADRIAMLHEGKIQALGTVDEIRNSKNPAVRQFLEGEVTGPLTHGTLDGGSDAAEDRNEVS